MRREITAILQKYPNGITTVDAAAQTMAALVMHGLSWHWDDDPRQCGFAEDEGEALNILSDQLWKVASDNFPIHHGDTPDAPMWNGLIDGLSVQDGIFAFRVTNEPHGEVYVAAEGVVVKVPRKEWLTAYREYELMLEDESEETNFLIGWMQQQQQICEPFVDYGDTSPLCNNLSTPRQKNQPIN